MRKLEDKKVAALWQDKIRQNRSIIKTQAKKWDASYRLWRGVRPNLPGEDVGKRSNLFIQMILPIVLTALSKELLYYFGRPSPLKIRIHGSDEDMKKRYYEKNLQKFFDFVMNRPEQFQRLYYAQLSKRQYGTIVTKVMPCRDSDDVVQTEPIAPWNAVWDVNALTNKELAWAGHEKVVNKDYIIDSDVYDEKALEKLDDMKVNSPAIKRIHRHLNENEYLLTEVWDKVGDELVAMLDRAVIVRREKMPHYFPYVIGENIPTGFIPPNSGDDNTYAMVGIGISDIEPLRDIQLAYNEMQNVLIDNISRMVHDLWLVTYSEDTWDLEHARPGDVVQVSDVQNVRPLYQRSNMGTWNYDLNKYVNEAYRISGIQEMMLGGNTSKRMTSVEVNRILREAHNRIWLSIKYSASSFWTLWAHKAIDAMIESGQDKLFRTVADTIDIKTQKKLYHKVGEPSLKDLGDMRLSIEPRPAEMAATEADKRQLFLEAMKVAMGIWQQKGMRGQIDYEAAKDLFVSTFEDSLPGIGNILKNKPMTPEGQSNGWLDYAKQAMYNRR